MKAIYIPDLFDPQSEIDRLNKELKNCHTVLWNTIVNQNLPGGVGTGYLLIVDDYTRKDKLEKLEEISENQTNTEFKFQPEDKWLNYRPEWLQRKEDMEKKIEINTLWDISNTSYLKDKYYIDCEFVLDSNLLPYIQELIDRKKQLGVVYGEFDPIYQDASLSRVSHTINQIEIENNKVKFKLEPLNTYWGKEIKNSIDKGELFRTGIRYVSGKTTKIFTVDIYKKQV